MIVVVADTTSLRYPMKMSAMGRAGKVVGST